jgi:hypothetical protein
MIKRFVLTAALGIAAVSFDLHPARAAGVAPWCAVISMGRGDAYWDCQYSSVEQCVPNVLAGNRGFCNPNPAWSGSADQPKLRHKKRTRLH